MTRKTSARSDAAADNAPLVDDIRLLGRILGDVIREQEGKPAYELIERVRQLSVAYRLKRDARAGRAVDRLLTGLSSERTVSVIRAFAYFSHLANIAEDRHQLRRRAVHERHGSLQRGSLAMAFQRLAHRGIDADRIADTLEHAWISPGAHRAPDRSATQEHPRCRTRDRRAARRSRAGQRCRPPGPQRGAAARAHHAALADAHAAHHQAARSTTRSRTRSATTAPPSWNRSRSCTARSRRRCRAVRSRPSSAWATGSAATATATRTCRPTRSPPRWRSRARPACAGCSRRSTSSVPSSRTRPRSRPSRRRCRRWQIARATTVRIASTSPIAARLIGVYARLAATLQALTGTEALRHAITPRAPYGSPDELLADLRVVRDSLCTHHAEALVAPRLAPLIRAVQVFGFHLATVDLRQSSDKHEAVVGRAAAGGPHRGRLQRARRSREARAAARGARRCARPARGRERARHDLQRARLGELAIFETAATCSRATAAKRCATTSSRTPRA